jgi:hypothetical protein
VTEPTGWFMAPRNVAFTVLGWLYGEGDFGKAICTAVNCGDDTDCTGATLGSLLGILGGTKGIPERWRQPVGEGIRNVAIGGFQPPRTLTELTDRTVAMAARVLAEHRAPVALGPAAKPGAVSLADPAAAQELWARSGWAVRRETTALRATLDFDGAPELTRDVPRLVKLKVEPLRPGQTAVDVRWQLPEALDLEPQPGGLFKLTATQASRAPLKGTVELRLAGEPEPLVLPYAFVVEATVDPRDLALAKLGAVATADGELDREPGSAAKAIDGDICPEDGFDARRWHSALTPHPHWIAIALPEPKTLGRVVIHFADPGGHPVDFDCQVSADGQAWTTVAGERGYADRRGYEAKLAPVTAKHFRLLILKSASRQWPDAAQVTEIELLPPEEPRAP